MSEEQASRAETVREAAIRQAPQHTRLLRSAAAGRRLSALMLPFFQLRPPAGFGVITTTGRKTGKARRKCVRVIRRGDRAYLVQLLPPSVARVQPTAVAGWLWNIRADSKVTLRIRGGTFTGTAREPDDPAELRLARQAVCETVNPFDYGECLAHLRGRPSREKIKDLHAYWFDTGNPLVIDLVGAVSGRATAKP